MYIPNSYIKVHGRPEKTPDISQETQVLDPALESRMAFSDSSSEMCYSSNILDSINWHLTWLWDRRTNGTLFSYVIVKYDFEG